MSLLLSERCCGIINLPASSLPAPAEACRLSRLPGVVKTRSRMERGENSEVKHRFMSTCMHTYKEKIQDRHKHVYTDSMRCIPFISSHAFTQTPA